MNLFRSILNLLTGASLITLLATIGGCTGDNPATPVVEQAVCTASYIPLEWQALAGMAFVAIGGLLKMFGGTGSVAQNVAAPVAPVVPAADAKPGVVTQKQVDSTAAGDPKK